MPIYEYQVKKGHEGCDYCKNVFEVIQKITDDPLKNCPECKSPLEKIISTSHFEVKGYNSKNRYSNEVPASKNTTD